MEPEDYLAVLRQGDVLCFLQLFDFLKDKWQLPQAVSGDELAYVVNYTLLNCGLREDDLKYFALLDKVLLDDELKPSIESIYRYTGTSLLSGFIAAMTEIEMQCADAYRIEVDSFEGILNLFSNQLLTQEEVEKRAKLQRRIMDSLSLPQFQSDYAVLKENLKPLFNIRSLFVKYKNSLQNIELDDEFKQRLQDTQGIILELMEATQLTENTVLKIYAMFEQWRQQDGFEKKECEFYKKVEPFLSQKLNPDAAKKMLKQNMVEDWMDLNIFDIGRTLGNWVSMSLFSTTPRKQDKKEKPLYADIVATL